MKKSNKYIILLFSAVAFMFPACDRNFDELNTNPVELTSVEPTFQLNSAILDSDYGYNNLTYETTIVKQMITPFIGVGTGGNLNQDNRAATQGNWQQLYRNVVKNLVDGIENVDPARTNLLSMLRIWKAHAFMVLTDTYGDVPYFDAGRAFVDGTGFPAYDSQQSIYTDILNELSSASAALDAGKDKVSQDILYGGNIAQWKKLGYSLLLRAAMRLSKVDPGMAQQFAGTAVAGGLLESNFDNALIRHNANFRNGVGTNVNGGQAPFYYLDQDFVNWMKDKNDPRLPVIAVRFVGAKQEGDQIEDNADRSFDAQIGMPQGYDNTTIPPIVEADGLQSLYDYSQMDRTRFGNPEAPNFLVTYSQTQLLLAEAIVRGWANGDAAAAYEAGIRAHMEQCAEWPGNTSIDAADVDAYIAANPLESGKEIELINGQYWMSSYLMGPEAWANFRRSGFPIVNPNTHPGSDLRTEDFIRRLTYPDSEQNINKANLDAAVARQGPDLLDTRVWWDVK